RARQRPASQTRSRRSLRITSSSSAGRGAFYGTGVAELLHMLRRDTIIIGGGATNRGVETSVREAFNLDLASVVVRECCCSGDAAAHAYSLDKAMKMYSRIRTFDQVAAMLRE